MDTTPAPSSSLMWIADRPPITFVRGEGSWLYDESGRSYLDFVQGWAVNSLGHAPIEIQRALSDQAAMLINGSPAFHNAPATRLARMLCELSVFDRVFFASSGAEANEGAIKLARKWGAKSRGGAYEIITFHGAFHGRTLATMSASGKPQWAELFEPKVPGFPKAPFGDIDSVARLINRNTVAVMLEPIQGETGVIPASNEFLRALRTLTHQHGLLMIVDEVQTGIGRTGRMFAYEHADIAPDIMTLAKGIGGGVPLAALLAREEVSVFEAGDQGGTYCGNPLMTAVGAAVVARVAEPAFMANVRARSAQLIDALEALGVRHHLGEVRGKGLLLGLDLRRDRASAVVERARALGLLVNAPRANVLRFMPALNVTAVEIDRAIELLDEAIGSV